LDKTNENEAREVLSWWPNYGGQDGQICSTTWMREQMHVILRPEAICGQDTDRKKKKDFKVTQNCWTAEQKYSGNILHEAHSYIPSIAEPSGFYQKFQYKLSGIKLTSK
jgi:hypothetical protein